MEVSNVKFNENLSNSIGCDNRSWTDGHDQHVKLYLLITK